MSLLEITSLICIFLFSFIYLLYNELEDEVVRDRTKNTPLKLLKIVRSASSGVMAKWYEPLVPFTDSYYPKWMKLPKHRERFKFSSTLFVFLTDKEHYYQFIKLRMINLVVVSITVFLVGIGFEILYTITLNQLGFSVMSFLKEAFMKNLN